MSRLHRAAEWLAQNYEIDAAHLGEYPIDHEETPVSTTLTDAFPGVDVLNQLTGRAAGLPLWSVSLTVTPTDDTDSPYLSLGVLVHDVEHVALWAAALDGVDVTADVWAGNVHTRAEQILGNVRVSVTHITDLTSEAAAA